MPCSPATSKAHWATGPGLGGCANCTKQTYPTDAPLLFDIEQDPSEAYPLKGVDGGAVVAAISAAYNHEVATFSTGTLVPPPDGPHEGKNMYGVCCDRADNP